jgi:signal transduction histidine kinase
MDKFSARLKQAHIVLCLLVITANFWGWLAAVHTTANNHHPDFYLQPLSLPDITRYADRRQIHPIRVAPGTLAERVGLRQGDILLTLNGYAVFRGTHKPLYMPGTNIIAQVQRGEQLLTFDVPMVATPREVWLPSLVVLGVAFVFWLIGALCWMVRSSHRLTVLFFWWMQATVAMWVTGYQTQGNATFSVIPFLLTAPLMGATMLHFCHHFPMPIQDNGRLLRLSYAGLFGVWGLIGLCIVFPNLPLWLVADRASMLYAGLTMLMALAVLLLNYRQHDQAARRQSRVLLVGIFASTIPTLALSYIPFYFFNQSGIEFSLTFPATVILPVTYVYVMRAGNLGRFDLFLNRSLVYGIMWIIGLGGYLVFYHVLTPTWSGGIVLLILLILSDPLRHLVGRVVDRIFYGGWYDYRTLVRAASTQLSQTHTWADLTNRLLNVAREMRFREIAVIWWHDATFSAPFETHGLAISPAFIATLRKCTTLQIVPHGNRILLALPIPGYGVMIFGERRGELPLDSNDNDILRTVAEQAAIAAAHIARLEEVAAMRDELVERQRRLTDSREAERLRLAQEIHDGPLQELYGLRFQLSSWGENTAPERIDAHLQTVSDTLRAICTELRPPLLAAFGLPLALRAYVDSLPRLPCVMLDANILDPLDERIQLVVYRIVQEAVNNALKHADATHVSIGIHTCQRSERILLSLCIQDDGKGFPQPVALHLRESVRRGHLGLLGMTERVQAVGGTLAIHSDAGQGTSIQVEIGQDA